MYEKLRRKKQDDAFRVIARLLDPGELPVAGFSCQVRLSRWALTRVLVFGLAWSVFVILLLELGIPRLPVLLVYLMFGVVSLGAFFRFDPLRWLVWTDRRVLVLHVSRWKGSPTELMSAHPVSSVLVEEIGRRRRWMRAGFRIITVDFPDGSSLRLEVHRFWGPVVDGLPSGPPPTSGTP